MLNYKNIHNTINNKELNGLIYLLRKFKCLSETLTLKKGEIKSSHTIFNINNNLVNIKNNFILSDDLVITSDDALPNSKYIFTFTVMETNRTDGVTNTRELKVSSDVKDDGILRLEILQSALNDNEVILKDFTVNVEFNIHEFNIPSTLILESVTTESKWTLGSAVNITSTLKHPTGDVIAGLQLKYRIGNCDKLKTLITDNNGRITFNYESNDFKLVPIFVCLDSQIYNRILLNDFFTIITDSSEVEFYGGNIQTNKGWLFYDLGGDSVELNDSGFFIKNYTDGKDEHVVYVTDVVSVSPKFWAGAFPIKKLIIPSGTVVTNKTNEGNSSNYLQRVLLSAVVTDDDTHESGMSIGEIEFGDDVILNTNVFSNSKDLKRLNLGKGVVIQGYTVFNECTDLLEVVFGEDFGGINGDGTLANCNNLKSIIFSKKHNIDGKCYNTFDRCTSIEDYIFESSESIIPFRNFFWINNKTLFIIPDGTRDFFIENGYPSNYLTELSHYKFNIDIDVDAVNHTINARLSSIRGVLEGRTLTFVCDGSCQQVMTDNTGVASVSYTDLPSNIRVRYYSFIERKYIAPQASLSVSKLYDTVSLHGSPNTNILTATVLDAYSSPCEAVEVVFSVNGSDTTVLTDANGVANYTYTAQSVSGTGEVSVIVSCGSLVETCMFYDVFYTNVPSQSGVSDFTANGNSSITYDSTNQAYSLQKISNETVTSITLNNLLFPNTVRIKADVMLINSSRNIQAGIGLLNGNTGINAKIIHAPLANYYGMTVIESTKTMYGSNEQSIDLTSSYITLNKLYTFIVEINNTNIVYKLYDGNLRIGTINYNSSVLDAVNNQLAFYIGFTRNSRALVKNIQVIEL